MERIRLIDLARGFTVLFIPAIHTGMLYSDWSVHQSLLGKFLIGIAEGPGGQLLMLLMGFSFTLKARHSTQAVLKKSIGWLLAGYLLNTLKFIIPYSYDALPDTMIQDLQLSDDHAVWQLLGLGDILHFAALAYLLLAVVYKSRRYHLWALGLAGLITVTSPLMWDTHSSHPLLDYMAGLATGQPPRVFFPLFPWLVYPLIGLVIGYYFRKNQQRTLLLCGITGGLLTSGGLLLENYFPVNHAAGFYRTQIPGTCWHSGIVLLALYTWNGLSRYAKDNYFFRLLTYSSKNITLIYLVQWVMICWMLPLFGYRELPLSISAMIMLVMTINTYILAHTFQLIKQYYGESKNL